MNNAFSAESASEFDEVEPFVDAAEPVVSDVGVEPLVAAEDAGGGPPSVELAPWPPEMISVRKAASAGEIDTPALPEVELVDELEFEEVDFAEFWSPDELLAVADVCRNNW